MGECVPSQCGTGNMVLSYTYDLAGNLTSSTDGAGVTSTYTLSVANELQSLTSSRSNSTNAPNLISGVQNGPNGPNSYSIGNGLKNVNTYDALGRKQGGWVCVGSTSAYCSGGSAQDYGFSDSWTGNRLTSASDTVLNQGSLYGYDEFNRLTSRTVTNGTVQNQAFTYDRWGNRWTETTSPSGPQTSLSFDTTTNHITGSGYTYDAAGNMTQDGPTSLGFHTYTYDAEGNITSVDAGTTAQYVYNALNQRVRTVVGTAATEFVFNAAGQRVSVWDGSTHTQLRGQYYWGSQPVAYYAGSAAHFQHQDWLGTERMRTTYNGAVEGSFTSLPFGDLKATSGTDGDPYHFASLDYDLETNTNHAQFRQYNSTQGRWMRPDPYAGSYDFTNPQSLNRYSYVLNNPLSFIDPTGLQCFDASGNPLSLDDSEDGSDDAEQGQCETLGGTWIPNPTTTVTVDGNGGSNCTGFCPSETDNFPTNPNAPNNGPTQQQKQCVATAEASADAFYVKANATMPTTRSAISWIVGGAVGGGWFGGPWGGLAGAVGGAIGVYGEPLSYALEGSAERTAGVAACYPGAAAPM